METEYKNTGAYIIAEAIIEAAQIYADSLRSLTDEMEAIFEDLVGKYSAPKQSSFGKSSAARYSSAGKSSGTQSGKSSGTSANKSSGTSSGKSDRNIYDVIVGGKKLLE